MSTIPLTETAAKRRLGDILLEHGLVTAEEIAEATLEQERTKQPLGQILVGLGAITRLELASALAEQWSDPAASIMASVRTRQAPAPTPVSPPSAKDEAQYAARLQEAVADLARKVQSEAPLDEVDDRVDELARRIEGTFARTQHIEAAVATLAESLEGVTNGVEEAFRALQTGTAALVTDLARLEQTVGELAARDVPTEGGPTLADLEELRAAVAGITEGTVSTAELEEQLNELAGRMNALSDPQHGLDDVSRRVEDLAEQFEALRTTTNLDELQSAVRNLEARAISSDGLAERLDRVEAESAGDALRTDLESQARLLDDLGTAVSELRDRPEGVEELTERLNRLEVGLDELTARLSERNDTDPRVDDVLDQIAGMDARLVAQVSDVEHVKAELMHRDEAAIDGRLDDLARSLELVKSEIADAVAVGQPDERSAERIDSLTAQVEMLAEQRSEGELLAARLEALEARFENLSQAPQNEDEHLAARLAELEKARSNDLDTVNVLAVAMDRIRHDLTTAQPPNQGEPAEVLDAVAALADRIAALEDTPAAAPAQVDADSELASEIERLRVVLERVDLHLGEHDHAIAELAPSLETQERLQELMVLVHDLAEVQQNGSVARATDVSPTSNAIGTLLSRVEEAEALAQTDSEKLLSRLERMASSIDWRLQRLENDGS